MKPEASPKWDANRVRNHYREDIWSQTLNRKAGKEDGLEEMTIIAS